MSGSCRERLGDCFVLLTHLVNCIDDRHPDDHEEHDYLCEVIKPHALALLDSIEEFLDRDVVKAVKQFYESEHKSMEQVLEKLAGLRL
jgi:hypothetical protein